MATVFGCLSRFQRIHIATGCHRLQPLRSIKAPSSVAWSDYELLNRFARPLGRSGDVTGSGGAPWRRRSGSNDRDRVHLDEEVGIGEALDDGGRDDQRIGSVAPRSLERRVAGTEVLAADLEGCSRCVCRNF